ncbi:hypothetical protein EHS25_006521 [Saitozyma podzolica]|uniref:Uncharacterized protein n=1 Tax=Saitozyma podzolica TaxID=1890683 RepID=A0A427YS15_9TREE|nr:hypothetical protein EHS25_006521 [Saitozyma podzolica]
MQPSADMLDTVPRFMESAGNVLIEGVYEFEASVSGTHVQGVDARKAFAQLESGRSRGKVVVKIVE